MLRYNRSVIWSLLLLALFKPLTSQAISETITDDLNNHLTSGPSSDDIRVASVSTFGAEMMLALGRKPVGMSSYPGQLPAYLKSLEQVPDLGPRSRTNFEYLFHTSPDIIIGLSRMVEPYAARFHQIAPLAAFDLITFEDSLSAVERSAKLLGKEEAGKNINTCFINTLEQIKQSIPEDTSGVFLTSAGVTPRAYYSHFMTVGIMERLNIENAIGASPYHTKAPFSGQVGLEWLLKLDPDVIFMYRSSQAQFTDSTIWQNLEAVKNNKVFLVDMTWREPEGPLSRLWVAMDIAHKISPAQFPAPSQELIKEALCLNP